MQRGGIWKVTAGGLAVGLLVLAFAPPLAAQSNAPNAPNAPNSPFPPGSWRNSCRDARMEGPYLRALCPDRTGQLQSEIFDTRDCRGGAVSNDNGQLRCQTVSTTPGAPVPPPMGSGDILPPGPWRESCRNPRVDAAGVMTTDCQNTNGRWHTNRYELRLCPRGPLGNADGNIVCMDPTALGR